jgi:hypothetical protein
MKFQYNDGGRSKSGYKGKAGDCGVRAIAIVTERSYQEVYDEINLIGKTEHMTKGRKSRSSARDGIYKGTFKRYMANLGWKWIPTMFVGQGCQVHLREDELPKGRIICNVSKHYVAVIDGVINDTFDPSRMGTRCVYGYWEK